VRVNPCAEAVCGGFTLAQNRRSDGVVNGRETTPLGVQADGICSDGLLRRFGRGAERDGGRVRNDLERKERVELHVGDVVGDRYELRRELGRGAGGLVFEALHRYTHRSIALKVVGPDVPRNLIPEQCARLMREAQALAAVRHPGIVEVLDAGLMADDTPFIVLERLDGRTLEGLLATRGKLSPEDSVAIGLQLSDALDALHHVGVVHRDLKPGNVFVVRDRDGAERLKLLDFGIALVRSHAHEKLTGIGALIGTPAYMSPEQLLAMEVDHSTDIYALGVTLFECLTGRLPYEGNYQSVLLQACSSDAKIPKVTDHVPEIGPELTSLVEKAIARKPQDRFATALDFGRALYAAMPTARSRTFFLGPPPVPKFGPPPAQKAPAQQRRRTPRAAYATPVQFDLENGASIDGRSEDLSEGGMLVICREVAEAGGIATVRFALPIEGKVVACKAHVRWVRAARPNEPEGPRAVGLEFIDMPDAMKVSITRYVTLMGEA
jgi:serine/threonine protein kinase